MTAVALPLGRCVVPGFQVLPIPRLMETVGSVFGIRTQCTGFWVAGDLDDPDRRLATLYYVLARDGGDDLEREAHDPKVRYRINPRPIRVHRLNDENVFSVRQTRILNTDYGPSYSLRYGVREGEGPRTDSPSMTRDPN